MIYVLFGLIALLLADRYLQARLHRQDLERSGSLDAQVIDFAERHSARMAVQLEEARAQVSEMATRIQHPEFSRPDIRNGDQPAPEPIYDDEYDQAGRIFEGE